MKKIAILGSENSHCWLFASVLAPLDGNKKYEDIELIGIYGDPGEPGVLESYDRIKTMSSCNNFVSDKDAFLEDADAVMITARDGAKHLKYAENYIKKGIPVWIDKPITRSTEEVITLVNLAQEHGAILSGGSSLEFDVNVKKYAEYARENSNKLMGGHITAPCNINNQYGGFWFYTQHLVAMITTIFGIEINAVRAIKSGDTVNAIYEYDNFSVSAFFGAGYSITVYTEGNGAVAESFDLPSDFFVPELDTFIEVIKTGNADKSTRDYIAPVFILEATIKAFESGEKVIIDIPTL